VTSLKSEHVSCGTSILSELKTFTTRDTREAQLRTRKYGEKCEALYFWREEKHLIVRKVSRQYPLVL
jgi:hypothetical protein